ncbi:glycosyltransferase [Streptococcus suis]|nr:glycosyltransferase [Streptococcus suis]
MNLAFTVSDSYIDYMGTTLYSIMIQTRNCPVAVYVLTSDISDYSRFKLQKLENHFDHLTIHILLVDPRQFEAFPLNRSHITRPEVYFRMAFTSLLSDLDRILYLDSDILAQKNLLPLWETPLDGAYMAAVSEPPSEGGFNYRRSIGMTDPTYYFNSGVLLMDLKKMREDQIEPLLFECGQAIKDKIRLQDQDIINVALEGKIKVLDPIYNYGYMEKQADLRKDEEVVLNHFSLEKPWNTHKDVPEYNRTSVNRYLDCHKSYLQFIEPKISLLVPIVEAATAIDKTLDAIRKQVYRNIDCIILDYSADQKTKEACQKFLRYSSLFRYYSLSPDRKNHYLQDGLERMAGSYLSLIQADDWVDPFYLAKLFLALENGASGISKATSCSFEVSSDTFYFFDPLYKQTSCPSGQAYLEKVALTPSQQTSYYHSLAGTLLAPPLVTAAWQRRAELPSQFLTRLLIHTQPRLTYLPEVLYVTSDQDTSPVQEEQESDLLDDFRNLQKYQLLTSGYDLAFYRQELSALSKKAASQATSLADQIQLELDLVDSINH